MITDVDATCEVDTAGGGLELSLPGLVNAPNFRACAIALKHGRDLPPLEEGTAPGTFQASAAQPAATHALHGSAIAGGGPTKSGYAPVPQDMSRETAEQQGSGPGESRRHSHSCQSLGRSAGDALAVAKLGRRNQP